MHFTTVFFVLKKFGNRNLMNTYLDHSPQTLPKVATLIDILRYRALHQPDFTAYKFLEDGEIESDTVTYQQLDKKARAILEHRK
jgi:hypothetical protein